MIWRAFLACDACVANGYTEPVTRDNDIVLMSKPCHQTSPVPYSTENCSSFQFSFVKINILTHFFVKYFSLKVKFMSKMLLS